MDWPEWPERYHRREIITDKEVFVFCEPFVEMSPVSINPSIYIYICNILGPNPLPSDELILNVSFNEYRL